MKPFLPILIVTILAVSCRSASSFESPNSLRNIPGELYLMNGDSLSGDLIIDTENFLGNEVKINVSGEKKPRKFKLDNVKAYTIRGEYFELKQIKGELSLGRQMFFMKRLTDANSRIHLYEHMQKITSTAKNNNGTTNQVRFEPQYYMQFPMDKGDGVWAVNSSRFVPNFNEKMSLIVKDCPALANKIANKEQGYFYAQVSIIREKRAAILWNIINEYNRCN